MSVKLDTTVELMQHATIQKEAMIVSVIMVSMV